MFISFFHITMKYSNSKPTKESQESRSVAVKQKWLNVDKLKINGISWYFVWWESLVSNAQKCISKIRIWSVAMATNETKEICQKQKKRIINGKSHRIIPNILDHIEYLMTVYFWNKSLNVWFKNPYFLKKIQYRNRPTLKPLKCQGSKIYTEPI